MAGETPNRVTVVESTAVVKTADAIVSTLIDNSLSAMSESMIVFPWLLDHCVLVSKDHNTKAHCDRR